MTGLFLDLLVKFGVKIAAFNHPVILRRDNLLQFVFKPATNKNIKPVAGLCPATFLVVGLINNCCINFWAFVAIAFLGCHLFGLLKPWFDLGEGLAFFCLDNGTVDSRGSTFWMIGLVFSTIFSEIGSTGIKSTFSESILALSS